MSAQPSVTATQWRERAAALAPRSGVFIDGRFVPAANGATFDNLNPATGRSLGTVAAGEQLDVDRAVASARAAFRRGSWSQQAPKARKRVLQKLADLMLANRDELALLETLDTGKPISDSLSVDIPSSANCIRWYAEAVDKIYDEVAPTGPGALATITREPMGVVGAIVPWNFPLLMASWKIGPILAAGNSLVLKPSEKSPLSALRIAELAMEAGLPEGVFNVVPGFGHTAGKALAAHMDVDCIAFTGSTATGKTVMQLAAQSNLKKVGLECGGKSPNIVLADAPDLDRAATAAAFAIFFNQGEMCSAGSRLLVQESIKDVMLEKIAAVGREMKPGDPLDPATKLGAIVDETQMKRVLGYIDAGKADGARVALGGARVRPGNRRLLRRAHGVRRREADDAYRPRGNLRPRARHAHVQERGRSHPDRQRRGVRAGRGGLDARHQRRASHGARVACRDRVCELLRRRRHHRPVRRLQAVGHRPRQVAARFRQVH
jgi:acyl-CoA reductase-like NAD-dependent aldehyde dehydrogenase